VTEPRTSLAVAAVAATLSLTAPLVAHAHGGRPQTYDVLFDPSDARTVVVPASFGILVSEDAGATFSLHCTNASPDPRPGTPHPTLVTPAGTVLVARELGLLRGPEHGCGLAYVEAEPRSAYFADVVAHPSGEALVLRSDADVENALYLAREDGTRLEALGATFPTDFLPERVRVAPGDGARLWVSGTARRAGTTFVDGRLYVSRDGGASHAVHTIPLELDERRLRVLAVDPRDPDHALAVIHALGEDRPLELRLVAGTLEVRRLPALPADRMRIDRAFAAAFLPDGTAWLGNDLGGLWALDPAGEVTVLDADLGLSCLVVHGEHVYLCADDVPDELGDGFAIARQRLGAPYAPEPVLRYRDIVGPRVCGLPSDSVCAMQWPETLVDLGRGAELDAGVALDADAGLLPSLDARGLDASPMDGSVPADAAPIGPTSRTPSCACAVLPAPLRSSPLRYMLLSLAVSALARKRRRT
jgi:hypothetical protein